MSKPRLDSLHRVTGETDIHARLFVDGDGTSRVDTGIPFFDHMLTLLAKHALFSLDLRAKGDVKVDFHHTVEDTGIVLGQTAGWLLDHGYGYALVLGIAATLHVIAFAVICITVPSIHLLDHPKTTA